MSLLESMPSLASNCSMSRLRYSRFLLVEEDRESHDCCVRWLARWVLAKAHGVKVVRMWPRDPFRATCDSGTHQGVV